MRADVFRAGPYRAVPLGADDLPRLQAFFDANPEYSLRVEGRRPPRDAAATEFAALPPADWSYSRRHLLGFVAGDDDALAGVADVIADLIAPRVWHVGLFIVATARHGSGDAQRLYAALEAWMREGGARWLRLGVVDDNERAARFWRAAGYTETRRRGGIEMGARVNTVIVMAKPLDGGTFAEYLRIVQRDRPDAP